MPANYDIGDIVRCSSTFTSTAAVNADPTTVDFVYTTPAGVDSVNQRSATTTGLTDSIYRVSTGVYYRDITTTASGSYWYRFSSTGTITTSAEWSFRVRKLRTTT
jgi:hypothetical protein